jgi:hypothetical protein
MYMRSLFWVGAVILGPLWFSGCMTDESPAAEGDGVAIAEQALSSDGPFTSVDELVNFWSNTPTGGAATEIFVNGHRKFFRTGFGPEFLKQYFVCAGGSIYATCPTGFFDGFSTFSALVSRSPSTATISRDGTLFRTGTNQFEFENITTCSVEQGLNGPVRYFKVTSYTSGFVPYSSSCYP